MVSVKLFYILYFSISSVKWCSKCVKLITVSQYKLITVSQYKLITVQSVSVLS